MKAGGSTKLAVAWLCLWFAGAAIALGSSPDHDLPRVLEGVSAIHPFGFDAYGRDVLLTALRGSFISSGFALAAVLLSTILALAGGTGMAIAPKGAQFVMLRGLDLILAFPALLFALVYAAVRGPGWDTLFIALLFGSLPYMTRLVHARANELLAQEYVLAARSVGATPARIVRFHLAPSILVLCGVSVPNVFAGALVAEATLSFMGIGAPIGRDTWGSLLAQSKEYLIEAPHLALGVGIPLVLTVVSLQILSTHLLRKRWG